MKIFRKHAIKAVNLEDLRAAAKKKIPRFAFDYVEGGVDDEKCLSLNAAAFDGYRLMPRCLSDVSGVDQGTTLFGRRYSASFGVAPMGMGDLVRHQADQMLLKEAVRADIPYIMSGASTSITLEEAARVSVEHVWYQLYTLGDIEVCEDIIQRCLHAGLQTLVLTVDAFHPANRERNVRNGLSRNLPVPAMMSALSKPSWLFRQLRYGMPKLSNYSKYAGRGATPRQIIEYMANLQKAPQTWRQVERYRQLWPGNLVVKGILNPDDAKRATEVGVDGVIVSNHGGRQLDRAPSAVEVFQLIREATKHRLVLMLDGGLRRGSDIVCARGIGAACAFIGRPFLYGVAADGQAGGAKAIAILKREVDNVLHQLGQPKIDDVDGDSVFAELRF